MVTRRKKIAIIGCGVIGRSWAIVFARAGAEVRLFDTLPGAAKQAIAKARHSLRALGMGNAECRRIAGRMRAATTMREAFDDAVYAQESVPETLEAKRAIFRQMDEAAPLSCILSSSCSSIPPADFMADLAGEKRCLVAHPFNPPHVIPLVELVAAPATAKKTIAAASHLLSECGQHPVLLHRPIRGFIGNRLQAAVVNEIMHLIGEGVASPADIDTCLRLGLGLRWSLMGPLETMDLNADGGIADYISKFGHDYQSLGRELGCREPWRETAIGNAISSRRASLRLENLGKRMKWRDRNLMRLREFLEDRRGGKAPKSGGTRR
jgi:3-hydroxyacyl-CoA dehydrogenase